MRSKLDMRYQRRRVFYVCDSFSSYRMMSQVTGINASHQDLTGLITFPWGEKAPLPARRIISKANQALWLMIRGLQKFLEVWKTIYLVFTLKTTHYKTIYQLPHPKWTVVLVHIQMQGVKWWRYKIKLTIMNAKVCCLIYFMFFMDKNSFSASSNAG